MRTSMEKIALLGAILVFCGVVEGAELFVNKQGNDANNGASRQTAFLTVQKGVNALKPGDTLTIGPGEYFENVRLSEFGDLNKETLIRAEVAGTAVLRGDRDVELDFVQTPGRRFVYVADCPVEALSVQESDTLTNLAPAAEAAALEFGPGRYFYDAAARKLYVSSSDFQPATRHHYTVGVLKDNGFHMFKCRRVVLDGLAVSGYRKAVGDEVLLLPVSGFMLHECRQCVVRRCTAFFNGSGITINSGIGSNINQPGEGRGNLVEECAGYANRLDGIVAYNPSGETIRNCRSFLNQTYGARFYGGRDGDALCLMENVIAWGNPGGDFWTKGGGLSGDFKEVLAERCVAFRGCMFGNFQHGLIGGGMQRGGERSTTVDLPDGHKEFHDFLDTNFADALNMDFRPQATSSLPKAGQGGTHAGPEPFKPNIYYVKANGNDALGGLSMAAAWKTPARAIGALKAGDTLYIAPGRYAGDLTLTARDVRIRGRGIEPAVIEGGLRLVNCESVSVERLQFTGGVRAEKGKEIELTNCVFAGPAVEAEGVQGLRVGHDVLTGPLQLTGCSAVALQGNLYAATPAVRCDSLDAVLYSSYNSYPDAARCWEAGGKLLSLDELRPRNDAYSVILVPELATAGGVTTVKNSFQLGGRGPLSTAIGPYREWQPKQMDLMGPFVESKSETSADIEWWSTLPVEVDLCWGDTPACVNRKAITQNAFYSYSLTGLQPGKKYYVKVEPRAISPNSDPARRFKLSEQKPTPIEFTPGGGPAGPATYYVSPGGDDARDGLSREAAWKSLQTAADRVRPGDTVLLCEGVYPGTFYFRSTGEPDKPITFKAAPGEKATIDGMGETLKVGFVMYGKHHYRLDSLYFNGYAGIEDNVGGAEGGALFVRDCSDLQLTRCNFGGGWGRCVVAAACPDFLVRNCVFMHSMEATMFSHCPNLRVENSVFIQPLITHLLVYNDGTEPFTLTKCILGENTRHKVHICFVDMPQGTKESDNCFYVRWPESERQVMNHMTLPEYRRSVGDTGSFAANPYMPGGFGWRRGWQQLSNNDSGGLFAVDVKDDVTMDFCALFATNPKVVMRGIGLQPEAFQDFHFWKKGTVWPYDVKWATEVAARVDAAAALAEAGKNAEAATAYAELTKMPLSARLKSEVLDRAAECATRAKDYVRAMQLAKSMPMEPLQVGKDMVTIIPLQSLAIRRQMAVLFEQKKFADLVKAFGGMGENIYGSWHCPEGDMVMADALYYLGSAYAETGDLGAAERYMRTPAVQAAEWGYSPGGSVLAVAWQRLGDFYRVRLKDDARALDAYRKALSTQSNPEISDALKSAAKSAAEILRKQGNNEEASKLEQGVR